MHRKYKRAMSLSRPVIGAAIEVHRKMGPGLLESVYERCLVRELELRGISAAQQETISIEYKGLVFEEKLRFDVLVGESLLIELKTVSSILPVHKAQLFSYMKLLDIPVGLLLNFHETRLSDGIARLFLPNAWKEG